MKQYCVLFLAVLLILSSACSDKDDPAPVKDETLQDPQVGADVPANATASTMGTFTSFAHGLSGKAVLYIDPQGVRTLRLENFTMTAGPDVYVLFSKTNNYSAANTVALSNLKEGYSSTNLNFNVGNDINTDTHKFVLVYCVQYSSLFGYSELMK
jgi:hypothetical protein